MVPVNFFALTLTLFNAIICYASMSVIDFCPLDCDSFLSSMKPTISQVTSVAIAGDLSIRAVAAPRTNPFAGSVDPYSGIESGQVTLYHMVYLLFKSLSWLPIFHSNACYVGILYRSPDAWPLHGSIQGPEVTPTRIADYVSEETSFMSS